MLPKLLDGEPFVATLGAEVPAPPPLPPSVLPPLAVLLS